ncbi:NAD(P)H-dependent oxidoreductase [Clostridium senegalense]|uniref:flavodoxin family protein n=1 Tax=Clostridium senegalense TaxID=1465809 RepID=UPI001C10A5A6|nr:flavodoxin [Clostridium senegalense]MBU5226984.1 NAD(P)H-dependent oxidoreductase [Clostridium senegalense]
MKSLVVFFSLENNTKTIAKAISDELDCELLELKSKKQYPTSGFKKFLWGGKSVLFKEKPELLPLDVDLNKYDNILIGTPIWVGTFPPPIKTFIEEYKIENKNIAVFVCHGGGGISKCYKDLEKQLPNNKFKGYVEFLEPLKKDTCESISKAKKWAKSLDLK